MYLTQKITKKVNEFTPNESDEFRLELIQNFNIKYDSLLEEHSVNPSIELEDNIIQELDMFLTYELYVFDK